MLAVARRYPPRLARPRPPSLVPQHTTSQAACQTDARARDPRSRRRDVSSTAEGERGVHLRYERACCRPSAFAKVMPASPSSCTEQLTLRSSCHPGRQMLLAKLLNISVCTYYSFAISSSMVHSRARSPMANQPYLSRSCQVPVLAPLV